MTIFYFCDFFTILHFCGELSSPAILSFVGIIEPNFVHCEPQYHLICVPNFIELSLLQVHVAKEKMNINFKCIFLRFMFSKILYFKFFFR